MVNQEYTSTVYDEEVAIPNTQPVKRQGIKSTTVNPSGHQTGAGSQTRSGSRQVKKVRNPKLNIRNDSRGSSPASGNMYLEQGTSMLSQTTKCFKKPEQKLF